MCPPVLSFLLATTLSQQPAPPRDSPAAKPAAGVIAGRITEQASGRPMPLALVTLSSAGLPTIDTEADAQGRYEFSGLAPGEYAVWATAGEHRSRGAVVSGRVTDERGESVPRARVLIFPADPARWGTFQVPSANVLPAGTFKLGPQRAGDYRVVALAPSGPVPDFEDRDRMAHLVEVAERVTLTDLEERTIDLRVANVR